MANDNETMMGNHVIPASQAGKTTPNIPVRPGESTSGISLGNHNRLPEGTHYKNLRSIADSGIGMLQSTISAAGHPKLFGEITEDEAILRRPIAQSNVRETKPKKIKHMFARGIKVFDTEKNKKCTILKLNAGYTKKTHEPAHMVVDARGNEWMQKESRLKLV